MKTRGFSKVQLASILGALAFTCGAGAQPPPEFGELDFGLTEKQLVQKSEKVEELIAKCMRAQGFEYIAVDYKTVREGMEAEQKIPGLSEEEFIAKYGFGISTLYTGKPPQLATGYSPAKVGLGRHNVEIYKSLSPADQVAYTRALTGEQGGATYVAALELEDLSRTDGCTFKAIEQVFDQETIKNSYSNVRDDYINADPRMRGALREFAKQMRAAGFDVVDRNAVEFVVLERLDAFTRRSTVPVEKLSPEQLAALKELQDYERRLAVTTFKLEQELIEPVKERVYRELFPRKE